MLKLHEGPACMQPAQPASIPQETILELGVPPSAGFVLAALAELGPQDEDCLTINVWTKPQKGERKKPVIVFVHGGEFVIGSSRVSAYDGKRIADQQDVVVVSFKYDFAPPSGRIYYLPRQATALTYSDSQETQLPRPTWVF